MKPWERYQQAVGDQQQPQRGPGLTGLGRRAAGQVTARPVQPSEGLSPFQAGLMYTQGATAKFGDELAASAAAIGGLLSREQAMREGTMTPQEVYAGAPFAQEYRQEKDFLQEQINRAQEQSPGLSMALEAAGAIPTGIAAGAVPGIGQISQKLPTLPFWQRAPAAAAVGGTAGGVVGAGEAETLADVPEAVLRGATAGAIAGPAVELGMTAAQRLARPLSPQRRAERTMRRAARRGLMSLDETRTKLREIGPGATLADVNEGLLTELDRIVNTPGEARTKAIKQLTKRSTEQIDEILAATGPGNYYQNLEATKQIRENLASPLYEQAYARGVPHTDELEDIWRSLNATDPQIWREAKLLGLRDAFGKGMKITEDMLQTQQGRPSFRGWNYMKMQLDDLIGAAQRSGNNMRAEAYREVKNRLLRELDSASRAQQTGIPAFDEFASDYATARGIWAGTKEFDNAMDAGMSFMRGNDWQKIAHEYGKLSETEKLGYREGARQGVQNLLEMAGDTSDLTRYFRKPTMRNRIKAVFGDKADDILKTIESSAAKQFTFGTVSGNSKTALRQAAQVEATFGKDVAEAVSEFMISPTSSMMRMVPRVARAAVGHGERTRNTIADMLLEDDPQKQALLLDYLMGRGAPMRTTGAGLLGPVMAGSGAGLLTSQQ